VGNAAYVSGGAIANAADARLYFPAGTYNISSPLVTGCAMFLSGTGRWLASFFKLINTLLAMASSLTTR